jgi:hypothetical protein
VQKEAWKHPLELRADHENPLEEEGRRRAVKLFGILEVAVELFRRKFIKM